MFSKIIVGPPPTLPTIIRNTQLLPVQKMNNFNVNAIGTYFICGTNSTADQQ